MLRINATLEQIRKDLNSPFMEPYKRAANIALPFLYLYQPTAAVLSFGLGIRQVCHLASEEQKDPLIVVANLFQLGLSYASPVGGAILASGTLLGKQVYLMRGHLSQGDWKQFGKEFLGTMITTVHLFAIFSGSPTVIAASIVFRSLSECQESYSFYQEGKWPEALGSLALAVIRASSARPYISESWRRYFSKNLTAADADRIFRRLSQMSKQVSSSKPESFLSPQQTSAQTAAIEVPSNSTEVSLKQVLEEEGFSHVIENLSLKDFPEGSLNFVDFSGIVFKRCSFSQARVEYSAFNRCRFENCQLDSIAFVDCDFNDTQIENTQFLSCRFKRVILHNAKIQDSFFTSCAFKKIVFLPYERIHSLYTQLEKGWIGYEDSITRGPSPFPKQNTIENTCFSSCTFDRTHMIKLKMKSSHFTSSAFKDAVFFHNTFEEVTFDRSSFESTYFNDSTLKGVSWQSSSLSESVFLGVQAENSKVKNCELTDAVFCEANIQVGDSNRQKVTKPVVSLRWDFKCPGGFAQIIFKKLRENGMVPLKYQGNPVDVDQEAVIQEMQTMLSTLERVQALGTRCIAENLFVFRASGSELDKIYNRAALLTKFSHAHLLPGGGDIEPELYGKSRDLLWETGGYTQTDARRIKDLWLKRFEAYYDTASSLTELAVLHHADRAGQRVMGICRGAQMINIFFGGTLRQHVPDQEGVQTLRPLPLTSPKAEEMKKDLFGSAKKIYAFSLHHQCAEKIGQGLHVLYESQEGVPKILVHENGNVIAMQCHPEVYDDQEVIEESQEFVESAPYFRGLFQRLAESPAN